MRKVLRRFLAHLGKERNATEATVKAYEDEMLKFIQFLEVATEGECCRGM